MPYRNMTLEEFAQHIGMDARVVRKWADRGKLPGRKVGGEWRFNRAEMLEWLQSELPSFEEVDIRNLERAMRVAEGVADGAYLVTSYLALEAIDLNLPARSRASVLRELVRLAERTQLVYNADEIIAALEERESMGSTALPRGIAFPHPRQPLMYATAEPLVCLARVPAGIPFGAPDGRLTDLFVLICAQGERRHLSLLARLAMMFNGDLADALRGADSAEAALELMLETEGAVIAQQ
jgi:PTS system nitrogen regulatory IIA component